MQSKTNLWIIRLPRAGALTRSDLRGLSHAEAAQAERFVSPLHGLRYARSHRALREILGEELGLDPGSLAFEHSTFGKPLLCRVEAVHFNLSHSGDVALIGVGESPLGVDVEQVETEGGDFVCIAKRMFALPEFDYVAAASDCVGAFYRCWVRKEAVVKAEGQGLSLPLRGFNVAPAVHSPVEVELDYSGGRRTWLVRDIAVGCGYAAALAHAPGLSAGACVERDFS